MKLSIPLKPYLLLPLLGIALAVTVSGDPPNRPTWWLDGNPPVIAENSPENNKGPANIGQAKHMAKSALIALRTRGHTQLADAIEADLVGANKPIATWDAPTDQAGRDRNHAPLLLGQLKAIAHPFYTRLHAAAPTWLAAERTTNGTSYPGSIFPWTTTSDDDANKAMATIGQLKAVFSLRFNSLPTVPPIDTDGDGISDSDEMVNGTDPDDYFNGQIPVITTISGSGQTTPKGQASPEPIVFQVTRGGMPLANAPIHINHPEGVGVYINPDDGTIYGTSMTLRADSEGKVFVYFKAN